MRKNTNASVNTVRNHRSIKIVATIIVLDQLSKLFALHALQVVKNTGGTFGIFAQKNLLFTFLSLITIAILVIYATRQSQNRQNKYFQYAILLIIGGGISNLFDRLFRGSVIDFIKLPLWPAFNLADACITLGIATIIWYTFFTEKPQN